MLFVLSPAKSLDYESPIGDVDHTRPEFVKEASALIDILRPMSPQQIAKLMDLSDKLASLNAARFEVWSERFTEKNSRQAVLAFDGDVYDGLRARDMTAMQLEWLQHHLRILSGLYGVLRPLDWMQPYRLEMGTALANPAGKNLYAYWGNRIAKALDAVAMADDGLIINTASEEYFKAVDTQALKSKVVSCVFEERKGSGYQVVSFYAKKARGLIVRYATEHQVKTLKELQGFNADGYSYDAAASEPHRLVFRRQAPLK
jgi:cytoplasmic iron level regulating protein YaaA (DUF328/UPF0246 family)